MTTVKSRRKPGPAQAPALEYSITLENALLQALQAAQDLEHPTTRLVAKDPAAEAAEERHAAKQALSRTAAKRLSAQADELWQQMADRGLLNVQRVRFRPGGIDRQLILESMPDPGDDGAVLLRVKPVSLQPLPSAGPTTLTTQEAADRLNVSRPHVIKLVDLGRFEGVSVTDKGHRRIPAAEVDRVKAEMLADARKALDDVEALTADLREAELKQARAEAKTRWAQRGA